MKLSPYLWPWTMLRAIKEQEMKLIEDLNFLLFFQHLSMIDVEEEFFEGEIK